MLTHHDIGGKKREQEAIRTRFEQGIVSFVEAQCAVQRDRDLEYEIAELRNHQFTSMATRVLAENYDGKGPSQEHVCAQLRQFALHIVSQLFSDLPPQVVVDLVDRLQDVP